MALTKAELLTEVSNTIDAAIAAPDKWARTVIVQVDMKYKILVVLGVEDRVEVSRRPVTS